MAEGGLMGQMLTWRRKTSTRVAAGLAIIIAMTLAPLALLAIAPSGTNWERLSEVSQIYATFLSAVAILGISASLAYQARQTALAKSETARTYHRELMMMTLNDPTLMVCWEPTFTAFSVTEARQIIFVNLIVSEWSSQYRLNHLNDEQLLMILPGHFKGEVARKHWEMSREPRLNIYQANGDFRGIQFVSLADRAYAQAVTEGPPTGSSAYFSTDG